jgi:hypothetical protein
VRRATCAVVACSLVLTVPAPRASALSTAGLEGAGAPMPLIASSFTILGAHTRDQALANLAAAGVRAVRQDFLWQRIEPARAEYHFEYEEGLVDAAALHGIEVLAILAYGNPLYSTAGAAAQALGTGGGIPPFGVGAQYLWPPDDLAAYRSFARATAARFAGRVHRYEVWNEENVGWRFWPPHEDAAAYAALLDAGARGIHDGDPQAIVSVGGVFYPEIPPGLPEEGGRRYLGHLYDANPAIGGVIDAVAWHPYPYPFVAPEVVLPGNSSVAGSADQVRDLLTGRNDPGEELWVTEVGWPTHQEYGVSPQRQAAYLARSFALLWAQGVPLVTWYTYSDGPNADHNQEDALGLFAFDGTPKPSYRALKTFTGLLGDAVLRGERTDLAANALVFERADLTKRVTMVWTVPETLFTGYGSSQAPAGATQVSLAVSDSVRLVRSTGEIECPAPANGSLEVEASFDPVYVVEGPFDPASCGSSL